MLPESTDQVTPLPAIPRTSTEGDHRLDIGPQIDERPTYEWDVLKSIVYGGLVELIASLGIISSAAGSNSTTCECRILSYRWFARIEALQSQNYIFSFTISYVSQ